MTIDEAIAKHIKIAKTQKALYDACTLKEQNKHFLREAEEHEQLVEWLEELKVYNQHEVICNKGYNAGYNKAIDDFIEKVELKYLGVHPDELYEKYYPSEICKQIKELAEQLKVGGENEQGI